MTAELLLAKASIAATYGAATVAGGAMSAGLVLAEGITVSTASVMGIIFGSGGVIGVLFKLLISSKEREYNLLLREKDRDLAELDSLKASYQKMSADALKSATAIANFYRDREGKAPLIFVPPVIPETQSPSTAKQREAAELQTSLAHLEAIKRATGQAPKATPEHEIE